jgi:hypothetical protein
MNHIPSFDEFVNESINEKELRDLQPSDSNDFVTDVLKLGSKQNLFDSYMKKNGIKPDQLSDLVNQVIDTLNKKWR